MGPSRTHAAQCGLQQVQVNMQSGLPQQHAQLRSAWVPCCRPHCSSSRSGLPSWEETSVSAARTFCSSLRVAEEHQSSHLYKTCYTALHLWCRHIPAWSPKSAPLVQ